jgi:hypothetical protein
MSVSVPTLIRMEKGDPSVGMGVYATALWLMGRHAALPGVAAPEHDATALAQDIEAVRQRGRRMHANQRGHRHRHAAGPRAQAFFAALAGERQVFTQVRQRFGG